MIRHHTAAPLSSPEAEIFGPTMDAILQDFHREGLLGPDNIFNHCTGLYSEIWQILRDAGVNVNVCPRSDAQYAMDEGMFAYQNAVDHAIKPAISIDTETSYGGDMFAEMRVAFSLQRAAAQKLRYAGYMHAPDPVLVQELLTAATLSGAHCAGLGHKTGSLTPGKRGHRLDTRQRSKLVSVEQRCGHRGTCR